MSQIIRWHRSTVKPGLGHSKIKPWLEEWFRGTWHRSTGPPCRCSDARNVDAASDDAEFAEVAEVAEVAETNEAPALDLEWFTADCEKLQALHRSSAGNVRTYLNGPENVTTTNGVPLSPRYRTTVCIGRSAKYATMTGTSHIYHWTAIREPGKNWINPLMGWTSSSDPYTSMGPLTFPSETTAVSFCEKNNYNWYTQRQPASARSPAARRYENNFHWSKKCRTSTR